MAVQTRPVTKESFDLELTLNLPQGQQRIATTGAAERNLKIIRETLGVHIASRDGSVRITGDSQAVGQAAHVIEQLSEAARRRQPLSRDQLLDVITTSSRASNAGMNAGHHPSAADMPGDGQSLDIYLSGKRVRPLTEGQQRYMQAILDHDLTFCLGPAGTGKTYLAVAAAAAMLKNNVVRKLVLVRPAVEAGEKLGFLPGSMQDKVNPYLRPLLDALHDMMEFDQIQRFMGCDLIEIVPLAFMRGRTLNDALVILDEAQNTTKQQMLMFLTRMGHGSKMIVTGDTTQIDLPDPTQSGLIDAVRRLKRVKGAAFVTLEQSDIVRHSLVQRIVDAYGHKQQSQHHEQIQHEDEVSQEPENNDVRV